jgi:nitric oxide reductase subunit C
MKQVLAGIGVVMVLAGTAWAAEAPGVYDKKCKACHSIAGVAGPMAKTGGALDGVGAKRDEAWLRAYFKEPKSKVPNAKMPKMSLSDAEWDALVAYMLSLKEAAPAK